jgi:hypothetical protein
MDLLQTWFNDDNRWIVGALLFGLVVLILTGLLHSGISSAALACGTS